MADSCESTTAGLVLIDLLTQHKQTDMNTHISAVTYYLQLQCIIRVIRFLMVEYGTGCTGTTTLACTHIADNC